MTPAQQKPSDGGTRRQRHGLIGRLSVRLAVTAAMAVLVLLALLGSIVGLRALSSAAFMLHRAETSYRQLSAYRQLSTDVLESVLERRNLSADRTQQALVERRVTDLVEMVKFEVRLIRENGGDETNVVELHRLERIRDLVEAMFAAEPGGGAAPAGGRNAAGKAETIYRTSLKPLLVEAIQGEQAEILDVEQDMRDLQARMSWLGPLAVALQVVVVTLVLVLVKGALLDPISRLVSDIKEIGRQKLGHRALVPRHDEFGLLAQHINRMARNLESGRRSLVDMNAGLEATVLERTSTLRQRNEDLREVDASRRRFFADVSHELRTPLTAIVGEADVTLRERSPNAGTYRQGLTTIRANAAYLGRRIDDLMALARSSDGRLEITTESVDLNIVASEAMGQIGSLAKVHGVETRFAPLDDAVMIAGDHARLRQGLMILLDNAVKFSRDGQVVDIALTTHDGVADLTVVDRGRGIAITELPLVFERYYQTEVGRQMGGTGLGLSIARRIVEAHGGSIGAERNGDGGTTIRMTFDLRAGAEAS